MLEFVGRPFMSVGGISEPVPRVKLKSTFVLPGMSVSLEALTSESVFGIETSPFHIINGIWRVSLSDLK